MFVREDWTLFRSLNTLGQKAGVPLRKLGALAVKELVDNALDVGADVTVNEEDGWIYIQDDGPGIAAEIVPTLFSIRRPLTSSKIVRLPQRGALGNGLRVVMGTVYGSSGEIFVESRGVRHELTPQDDGYTHDTTSPCSTTIGTRIGLKLGVSLSREFNFMSYAKIATAMAKLGKVYKGKTSPWWYDADSFFEMLQAGGSTKVKDILCLFRSITPKLATMTVGDATAENYSRADAVALLSKLRKLSKKPSASSLGKIGDLQDWYCAHTTGSAFVGHEMPAQLPFSLDVMIQEAAADHVILMVNRTPVTGNLDVSRIKPTRLGMWGCGLGHGFDMPKHPVQIICNITTPYMPITTDGKEPDLDKYAGYLIAAVKKAVGKLKRASKVTSDGRRLNQKDVIDVYLDSAIDKVSGEGLYRYSLRQLYYAIRPLLLGRFDQQLNYNYFASVITDIEGNRGSDLPGLYRDARGVIYHPHTREIIPLGTMNAETYDRPAWTFNKILYSEKEGLFNILKGTDWPERNDCALMTSKGFASRAARDVLDMLGDTSEDIYFFCIHDADASGTLIYQSLTEATRARGARKVHIVNLGLEPQEALDMGLEVEVFREYGGRTLPVADYVNWEWEDWLQTQRVELDSMTTPQLLEWLDGKFSEYATKIVPPSHVVKQTMERETEEQIRRNLAAKILLEADLEGQVRVLSSKASVEIDVATLTDAIHDGLEEKTNDRWDAPLKRQAELLANEVAPK